MTDSIWDLNDKVVLITGGAGFVGSNLAHAIEAQFPRCRVVVFDAFELGDFRNLRGFRGECLAGDVSNPNDVASLARFRFDAIFHQAAISDTTVTDQQKVVRVNTNALQSILDLAAKSSARVVYASSAGTYGNSPAPHRVGFGEEPANVYGFSKLMMDRFAAKFRQPSGCSLVGLRYFNVYGPREIYKGNTASMILQLAEQMLSGRQPKLFKWGEQLRDFVYIDDVVQANLRALTPNRNGVFNVGSGQARSFNDVVEILANELQIEVEVKFVDNPWTFYQNHTQADLEETQRGLGYEPRYMLEAGIRAYLPEIRRVAGLGEVDQEPSETHFAKSNEKAKEESAPRSHPSRTESAA